jgi:hypothetical protein
MILMKWRLQKREPFSECSLTKRENFNFKQSGFFKSSQNIWVKFLSVDEILTHSLFVWL